jgi:hypothetical protein
MYYVQRMDVPAEPGIVGERLSKFMRDQGFRMEGERVLPCCRFVRGNPLNGWIAIGPQWLGVTVDARIEPALDGGSRVDLAWNVNFTGQLRGYVDMAYWRVVLNQVRAAAAGFVVDESAIKEAAAMAVAVSCVAISVVVVGMLGCAFVFGDGPWKIVVAIVAAFVFALPFHDWRAFRE